MQTIDYSTLPQLEAQLIAAALAGETSGLIEHLYSLLRARAARLVGWFQATYGVRLDLDDLTQEGIVAVLRNLDAALATDHPVPRLLTTGHYRMIHWGKENRSSIRVPHATQERGAVVPRVASLDAALTWDGDMTLLDLIPAGG